jgi:glycosyltransferase involved in cell wall biosynthesis
VSDAPFTGPVSVIIPTHNRARFLPEAIRSALGQGLAVGEVIVVDDGSTDDTSVVLAQISDPRLRVLRQEQSGPAAARDHGWREARGEWIQFLDSDDGLASGAITALLALAQGEQNVATPQPLASNPASERSLSPPPEPTRRAGARRSDRAVEREVTAHNGVPVPQAEKRAVLQIPFGESAVHAQVLDGPAHYTFNFAHRSGHLLRELCFYSAGTILSCLLPKAALEHVGGFADDPAAHACEDFDFALRLALHYEFVRLPRVTYQIRMHDANRHRAVHTDVWEASLRCVDRRLAGRAGCVWLRRRAMAYYGGLVAQRALEEGRTAEAAARYRLCLRWWPLKLGAWKGLLRALAARTP